MKKFLFLAVFVAFAAPVFAQLLPADTIPALINNKDNQLARMVGEKLKSEKEKAEAAKKPFPNTEILNIEYKAGKALSLMPFNGRPVRFKVETPAGKEVVLLKNKHFFEAGYNRYDFAFDFKVVEGGILVTITPKEKVEPLEGTIKVTFSVEEPNSKENGGVSLGIRAVTMDDVNGGLGWGESSDIAYIKQ